MDAERIAAEKLPCKCDAVDQARQRFHGHPPTCPAHYRPAIAAELIAAGTTPPTMGDDMERYEIARQIYNPDPDIGDADSIRPWKLSFDRAVSWRFPKAMQALKRADAIVAMRKPSENLSEADLSSARQWYMSTQRKYAMPGDPKLTDADIASLAEFAKARAQGAEWQLRQQAARVVVGLQKMYDGQDAERSAKGGCGDHHRLAFEAEVDVLAELVREPPPSP